MSNRGPLEDLIRSRSYLHRSEPTAFRWAKGMARAAVLTIVAIFLAGLLALPFNIVVMALVGIIHANILPAVIPASYWACYPVTWILSWFILNGAIALQSILKD